MKILVTGCNGFLGSVLVKYFSKNKYNVIGTSLKSHTHHDHINYIPGDLSDKNFIFMVTKNGIVKKTNLSAYSRPRKTGIIALTLKKGDALIGVKLTDGNQQIILATRNGKAVRFNEVETRSMGRTATGVKGIKLKNKDIPEVDLSGIELKLDNLSSSIKAFEER